MGGSVMRRSKMMVRVCIGVAAGSALGLVALEAPVSAAPVELETFEDDNEGDYPNDWEVYQERVVLGDTVLGGCTSLDSANYSNLDNLLTNGNLYAPEGGGTIPSFGTVGSGTHNPYSYFREWRAPGGSSQYLVGGTLPAWTYDNDYGFAPSSGSFDDYPDSFWSLNTTQREELMVLQAESLRDLREDPQWSSYDDRFDVAVLDGNGYGIGRDSQVLQLYSWTEGYPGHVIHGPAVVSKDTLTVTGEAVITFQFRSSADMDYYHVYGYLQNADCSVQIELFDATGEFRSWEQITVDDIPAGTYRFVFVAGTYDGTWGTLGGSLLWIDDIECEGEASGANGTCTVDNVCDDGTCGANLVTGGGLELDEIEFLPNESGPTRPIQWIQDALAAETVEELPSTGSNTTLLSLAGALLVLGSGVIALRRRQAGTASSR